MLGPALLALAVLAGQPSQMPPIGVIDFYGVPPGLESRISEALQLHVGDPVPDSFETVEAAKRRIEALPGVSQVRISLVCCESGKSIIYVGVERAGHPALRFRDAPTGSVRLPDEVVKASAAFEEALPAAVLGGRGEDDSQGHALMNDPTMHAIQEQFITFAARDLPRLRDVLRNSSDESHRALAALVIGYAADKKALVPDLVAAVTDPGQNVRNNATRDLGVIAMYAQGNPHLGIVVPAAPFIDLLNSIEWTDRNKSLMLLNQLTAAGSPGVIDELRRRALPSLLEMAQWKGADHAQAAFFIVGRIAGVPEDAIAAAWERGDRAAVIDAATTGRTRR